MSYLDRYQFVRNKTFSKAHDTLTFGIKCILPKELRNSDLIAKPFRPFISYLPLNFVLKSKREKFLKDLKPYFKRIDHKG